MGQPVLLFSRFQCLALLPVRAVVWPALAFFAHAGLTLAALLLITAVLAHVALLLLAIRAALLLLAVPVHAATLLALLVTIALIGHLSGSCAAVPLSGTR